MRGVFSSLAALAAALLVSVALPVFAQPIHYEFETDGNAEGWDPLHSVGPFTVSGGLLSFDITGPDPYIISPSFSASASSYPYMLIRARMAMEGMLQVFWKTSLDPVLDEQKSYRFQTLEQDVFHEYILDLSAEETWADTITQLRFDPPSGATSGLVEIDYVRITDTLPPNLEAIPLSSGAQVFVNVGQAFEVATTISNTGTEAAHDVEATLALPPGFVFDGSTATQTFASVAGLDSQDVAWTVRADQEVREPRLGRNMA